MQPENPDSSPSRVLRLCHQCGQPTPMQVPECVNCGARSLEHIVAFDRVRAEQRFTRAYFSRATPLTYAILGLNLILYLVMTLVAGGDFLQQVVMGVDPETLIAFGAKTNALLGQSGEWFRLVTPIFIHGGLIHILSNSYALWIVGPQVERLYGSARFVLIYLLSGIGGVAGSYIGSMLLGRNPAVASVGASGAIFGLFGVIAVFGFKYRDELPANFRRAFGSSVFPVIAINLFIGFSVPVIDNGAHIGGLITGGVIALTLPYIAPGKERVSATGLLILGFCVLIVGYCFVRAWQHSPQHLNRRAAVMEPFLENLNEANRVMSESLHYVDEGQGSRNLRSNLERVAGKMELVSAPDSQSAEIGRQFARILREQYAALGEGNLTLRSERLSANAATFARVSRELRQWVGNEGSKLGIVESSAESKER